MLHTAHSANSNDFALVVMLGLLGLRIFEATSASIEDLGEEHGHGSCGYTRGDKVVLVPLPPAVTRAIDHAVGVRTQGPILRSRRGPGWIVTAQRAGLSTAQSAEYGFHEYPHMLRHTFVTTMLDAGVDLRDVQIAARHADPRTTMRYDRARQNLDSTPTTSSPPSWPQAHNPEMPMSGRPDDNMAACTDSAPRPI